MELRAWPVLILSDLLASVSLFEAGLLLPNDASHRSKTAAFLLYPVMSPVQSRIQEQCSGNCSAPLAIYVHYPLQYLKARI